jgi:hypothetical protein
LQKPNCERQMNHRTGRRFHSRYMLPYVIAAVVGLCLLAAKVNAKWHTYKPSGAVDGQGIYKEMMSRCPEYMMRQIRSFDKATQAHEATHAVNGDISQSVGQSYGAFYTGDGKCFVLSPAPNVTVGQVAQLVPQGKRTSLYKLYLTGDRVTRNCLTLIDEAVCYQNDAQATQELRLQDDGGLKNALQFVGFVDTLVQAVRTHDPQYAGMQKLLEFVKWQRERVVKLVESAERSILRPRRSLIELRIGAAADPQPCDIPLEWRELNRDGSCVHISYANSMRHLGLHDRAAEYRRRYKHGESPGPHKRKLEEFGAKYAMTTDGDPKLIEYAIANRRMISWTDMSAHYRNLVGRKDGKAVLLGNGPQGRESYQYVPWEEAMRAFNNQGGWAVVCLEGCPPPPSPR